MYISSPIGDSNPQLGIIWPFGYWGLPSEVKLSQSEIPNAQLDKTSPIGYFKYPIGHIMPNWVFALVSPLLFFKIILLLTQIVKDEK